MLQIVQELESNGRHLQHFCRELARYFRNLLVAKVAGSVSRLIAASDAEQTKMIGIAAKFSEEDLTRYLHITLELYRDLQYSLQPRLHLELGLLRLVHAGRLVSLEEALAGVTVSSPAATPALASKPMTARAPAPPPTTAPFRAPAPVAPAPPPPTPPEPPADGDARTRLLTYLRENNITMVADAVEDSQLREGPSEWQFTASKAYALAFKDSALKAAVEKVAGRPIRISYVPNESNASNPASPAAKAKSAGEEDEATQRAMGNPEVQSFQELFPGSQVRNVRNLKD